MQFTPDLAEKMKCPIFARWWLIEGRIAFRKRWPWVWFDLRQAKRKSYADASYARFIGRLKGRETEGDFDI